MRVKANLKLKNGTVITGQFNTDEDWQKEHQLSDNEMLEYLRDYCLDVTGDLFYNLLSDDECGDSDISTLILEEVETE